MAIEEGTADEGGDTVAGVGGGGAEEEGGVEEYEECHEGEIVSYEERFCGSRHHFLQCHGLWHNLDDWCEWLYIYKHNNFEGNLVIPMKEVHTPLGGLSKWNSAPVSYNLLSFDPTRVLRNIIENELKKLVLRVLFLLYISFIIKCVCE